MSAELRRVRLVIYVPDLVPVAVTYLMLPMTCNIGDEAEPGVTHL